MKLIGSLLCAIILFSGMKMERMERNITISSFPLTDTLVAGIDNEIQLLEDGQKSDFRDISVDVLGADLRYESNGKFIAFVAMGSTAHEAKLRLSKTGEVLMTKTFVVVDWTPELDKRIQPVLAKRKTETSRPSPSSDAIPANGYGVKTLPLQDTLLPGFENTMQIYLNGQPNTNTGIQFKVTGATVQPSMKRGIYIVHPLPADSVSHVSFELFINGGTVLTKQFVVPVMTPELSKRAEALIVHQK